MEERAHSPKPKSMPISAIKKTHIMNTSAVLPSYDIRLICGNANRRLAEDLASTLHIRLEPCRVRSFADGEIDIHIDNNVRGADVFILQSTCGPVNNNLMELLLLIHTLKLSSAKRITAVIPYFGYSRQDRKTKPRVPISASAVAQLIEKMGPHRILTVDLHTGQVQGFFHQTPVDNLFSEGLMVDYIKSLEIPLENLCIVSTDSGGITRARRIADKLSCPSVISVIKRKAAAGNQIEGMQLAGDVTGRICVLVDDIIDTGNTLTQAAAILALSGAQKVYACVTHGIFSKPALDRVNSSDLIQLAITDSIPQEENLKNCTKLKVLSLVPLLAQAIENLHGEQSLSRLFE